MTSFIQFSVNGINLAMVCQEGIHTFKLKHLMGILGHFRQMSIVGNESIRILHSSALRVARCWQSVKQERSPPRLRRESEREDFFHVGEWTGAEGRISRLLTK